MVDVVNTSVTRIYENQSLTVTARIDKSDVESIEEVTFKFLKDGKQFEEKTVPIKPASPSEAKSSSGGGDKGGGAADEEKSSDSEAKSEGSGEGAGSGGDESGGEESKEAESGSDDSDGDTVEETAEHAVVSHTVKAPEVDDDKSFYFLDYHYFYKVKSADGKSETLQNFPANRIQVFPRFAQLKVTDKDGKAFKDFRFYIEQDGKRGEVNKTFAGDTVNAKGKTVPAGSSEFNLGLFPGFRVVPCPPFRVTEEVVSVGRKREVKGMVGFRAKFVAPVRRPRIIQYVDYAVENNGQGGLGHEVLIEVGPHPEDVDSLTSIAKPEVHFRVTYGPPADEAVAKSARDDKDHPTKVSKPSAADKTVTVEEKEAKKKYQGKVELVEGAGKFLVGLGKAGGDTCTVEISGAADFLTDASIYPDETIVFENWRRVHYELMVPDILREQIDESLSTLRPPAQKVIDELGRSLFIEFVHESTQVFNAAAHADYGTLAPRKFFELPESATEAAYILSGRNWRKPPAGHAWVDKHPGKTLCIAVCDALYKWRQDTEDEKAGTKDFSGTLKDAIGSINVEEKFEGFFMPFSGHDSKAGVASIHWTADISKDDAVCKVKPVLTVTESRPEGALSTTLGVTLESGKNLPAHGAAVLFARLPYPSVEIVDKTTASDKDDGKLKVKDANLGQELALEFELVEEEKQSDADDPAGESENLPDDVVILDDEGDEKAEGAGEGDPDDLSRHSFSDWKPMRRGAVDEEDSGSGGSGIAAITQKHRDQLDEFFRKLFKDGKAKLSASPESNKFALEIHGGTGDGRRSGRIAALRRAILASHHRTNNHDQYDFKKDIASAETEKIQAFLDAVLVEHASIGRLKGKVEVLLSCPKDEKHGVDDCFKAVKDKLKELFDKSAKEFAFHPGLDSRNDNAPREGELDLATITDIGKSSVREWHFILPTVAPDGTPGPGSIIGPSKTADQCPVKFELAFQSHEISAGESDGKLIAWACSGAGADKYLASLILRGFAGTEDKAAVAHGHGDKGLPGDCLLEAEALCDKCIAHGRSRNLTAI